MRTETATRTVDQYCLRQRLENRNKEPAGVEKYCPAIDVPPKETAWRCPALAVLSLITTKLVVYPAPARLTHECGRLRRR